MSCVFFFGDFYWRHSQLSRIREGVLALRPISFRLWLVAVITLAMTASGFAHKTAQAPMDPDLAAYLEVAGTIEGICGTLGKAAGGVAECEACRLADTTMTPTMVVGPSHTILPITCQMQLVALLRHHAKPLDPSQHTRAPPRV